MIKLLNTTKLRDDCYSVTIQDDSYAVGKDEAGLDIYWTTSLVYNPANTKESLKVRFEEVISNRKTLVKAEADIVTDIKPTIEAIDISKIAEVK